MQKLSMVVDENIAEEIVTQEVNEDAPPENNNNNTIVHKDNDSTEQPGSDSEDKSLFSNQKKSRSDTNQENLRSNTEEGETIQLTRKRAPKNNYKSMFGGETYQPRDNYKAQLFNIGVKKPHLNSVAVNVMLT